MKIDQRRWLSDIGWVSGEFENALAGSAQLVFIFGGPSEIRDSGCFDLARKLYPNSHRVGCTTAGEIQGTSVTHNSVIMTAVAFEHTAVKSSCSKIESPEQSRTAGEQVAGALPPDGLSHVFVLSEGLKVNPSELVRGITSVLPRHVRVTGGFAGDGDRLCQTHVWCDGEPEESAVVVLGFYGNRLKVGTAATGAWGPFGPDRLVTKSRGNTLYELDGRSALSIYKMYLGELSAGLPATGLTFPLLVHSLNSEHGVLRGILAVDELEESITFAGDISEGSYARLVRGTIEGLIQGTLETAKASVCDLGTTNPELSILVSCNGRRHVLKQRLEEEVDAVRDVFGPQTALTGFYSYGEIAPLAKGEAAELHNETMTITAFSEV